MDTFVSKIWRKKTQGVCSLSWKPDASNRGHASTIKVSPWLFSAFFFFAFLEPPIHVAGSMETTSKLQLLKGVKVGRR